MAIPRVFISSTCYDLNDVRDILVSFIKAFGFEPILSERGDVFFHPDLHTHESCVCEIKNCELFILIIGGRFGGQYISDKAKSIVNAEYFAARECGIPVFTFVKSDVLSNQRLYKENRKSNPNANQIKYPSIEKQEYAEDIFNFIDEVHYSKVNNGIHSFVFAREIQDIIRKQWAGMFFDFLTARQKQNEIAIVNQLLSNLTLASKKSEEILENIYIYLDKEKAVGAIEKIDSQIEGSKFFNEITTIFQLNEFIAVPYQSVLQAEKEANTWYDFVLKLGDFETKHLSLNDSGIDVLALTHLCSNYCISIGGEGFAIDEKDYKKNKVLSKYLDLYKKLEVHQKETIIAKYSENGE